MTAIKQPIITQSEISKTKRYASKVEKNGYRPWVTVRQSRTHGQGQIIDSYKTGRLHHLLSRGELRAFLHLERDKHVVDILEQYPLPITQTMELATQLNILHPGNYKERHKHDWRIPAKTMTTDFLVIRKNGSKHEFQPYSFKYAASLDPNETSRAAVTRTLAKLELEKAFWQTRGLDLIIATERNFDKTVAYNLTYLRECFYYNHMLDVSEELNAVVVYQYKYFLQKYPESSLKTQSLRVTEELNISPFQALCLFQRAAYQGYLPVDLTQPISEFRPVPLIASRKVQYAA